MDLSVLDFSYKWNQALCDLSWLASFIFHNVFKVHPCCSIAPLLFIDKQYSVVWIHHILVIYSSVEFWRNLCFWTLVLEKTLENPLDCKEIKPVNLKGNQSWIFIGRTDVEAYALILWPPDMKNWLTEKDPDADKDWRQEEKGIIEDEMVGWHHWHEWTWVWAISRSWWWTGKPGCSPWGCKELDMTEQLSWWTQWFFWIPTEIQRRNKRGAIY